MSRKVFFQKLKSFIKRNLPAMAVSFCMIFALSLVTAVAVTRMQSNEVNNVVNEDNKPVAGADPIVFVLPVEGAKEGLPYAPNRLVKYETLNKWQTHEGVDFVAIAGTKVVCPYNGKVESIETSTRYGTVIVIDHGSGLKTVYKSLSPDVTVKVGAQVKQGEQLGMVSNTAYFEESLGAHLHFEVLLNGEYKDPFEYLPSSDK